MQTCAAISMDMAKSNLLNKENHIGNLLNSLNVIYKKLESPLISNTPDSKEINIFNINSTKITDKTNVWRKAKNTLRKRTTLFAMLYNNNDSLPRIEYLSEENDFAVHCTNAGHKWCLDTQFTKFITSEYLTCYQYNPPNYTIFPGVEHGATMVFFTGGEILGSLSKHLKDIPGFNTPFFYGEGADGVRLFIHRTGKIN